MREKNLFSLEILFMTYDNEDTREKCKIKMKNPFFGEIDSNFLFDHHDLASSCCKEGEIDDNFRSQQHTIQRFCS